METSYKIGITSTVLALTCAAVTYVFLKHKYGVRKAVDALNYLTIVTVTNVEACDSVVAETCRRISFHRAVGFDCEWVTINNKRQPVGLVQISTLDGFCVLFRLSHMKTVPQSLKNLLEDEFIYKLGVGPYNDGLYLQQDYGVNLKSSLDIRHLAELCGYNPGGLAALSKEFLQVTLDKYWRIRCSDWDADELSDRQIHYAAADAHVAIRIFVKLFEKYHNQAQSWLGRRDSHIWKDLDDLCWTYTDVRYNTNGKSLSSGLKQQKKGFKGRSNKTYNILTRSKPLYHNCVLEAPDGEMLCTCDTKKAMWYVEKNLAEVVIEEPLRIRLKFEPAGRSVGDVGRYYQLTKENKCVVCGSAESYIRKNVVPREYRKNFPEIMKEHSSHDVVLLCVVCHKRSNMLDQTMRERLAAACAAPLPSHENFKFTEDHACRKVRSVARALLHQAGKLPTERRVALEAELLAQYPDHTDITKELLHEAAQVQVVYENSNYECHGQKVVDYYLEHHGLLKLEELWREHFLTTMRPEHMPELWSIKHNEERLRVRYEEGRLTEENIKSIGLKRWID